MQKKIIALAVAGLMSGAAFAQSNVTVFGVIDVGFNRSSDSLVAGRDDRNAIDSGNQSGSRVGFRGTEDLGGGLKASFQYVLNVSPGMDVGGAPGTRESNLALSGNFGTVIAGYMFTPQFNMLTAVDPFANGTVGTLTGTRGVYAIGTQGGNTDRLQNLIAYVSPSFSGFTVLAGYSFNGTADEVAGDTGNNKVWALNPTYSNGPIYAGLNIHQIKNDLTNAKHSVWDLAASYNFGAAKLGGAYGQTKLNSVGTPKEKQWMLGVTVPVGKGNVLASYSQNKFDTNDAKLKKFALGYTHDLSKRTNLYAVYADVSGNAAGDARVGTLVNMGGALTDRYTNGMNLGVRHRF